MSRGDATLRRIARLHEHVDTRAGELARRHRARIQCCRGCWGCCVDGLTVFDVEAERIRRAHSELLAEGTPHPPGACAFLDGDGACRVYAERPYVCRTQGLPLRWLDADDEDAVVELRDICPLNELEGEPVEDLAAAACWTIGPVEDRIRSLQEEFGAGVQRRVALRSLFASDGVRERVGARARGSRGHGHSLD
jgi:hypothetical protein